MTDSTDPAPIVQITHGSLRGVWEDDGQIAVFKGIPFAKPPVGALRWQPPQPVDPWEGVREATKFGPTSWQRLVDFALFFRNLVEGQGWNFIKVTMVKWLMKLAPTPKQDEDCLYLNVRTPSMDPEIKLPVMVWIHGGDHQDGSGSDAPYIGNALPHKEVVYVTINYRLGLMGYFAHPDLTAESPNGVSGNYGTLDQIAALQWVQENIAHFGGDPNNVTIFGESAGGESVAHMMTSPLAKGLFHSAIMQSPANAGQMMHLFNDFEHYPSGQQRGELFAERIGVTGPDQLEQLRQMSAAELYEKLRGEKKYGTFYPLIDGYVLPQSPFSAFHQGLQTQVPLLVGSNADEGTLIAPLLHMPYMQQRLAEANSDQLSDQSRDELQDELAQLHQLYPGLDKGNPNADCDQLGDDMFGAKAHFYALHAAKTGQPTYLYHFGRVPPNPRQTIGAYHAAEIAFVHGTSVPILPMAPDEKALSYTMIGYWTEFARSGDPNGTGRPEWTTFHSGESQWMYFSPENVGMQPITRTEKYELLNRRTLRQIEAMNGLRERV